MGQLSPTPTPILCWTLLVLGMGGYGNCLGEEAAKPEASDGAGPSAPETEAWARFRGPNGTGQSEADTVPLQWTDRDYRWKIKLPGSGHSSPSVWGRRVVITSAQDDGTLWLQCVDALTGTVQWQERRSLELHHLHPYNSFASSTPALDGQRVYWCYAMPKRYVVEALRLEDGQLVWQSELGPFESEHGFGASPIVVESLVIVPNEQDGQSSVVAFDAGTGRVRWQCPRRTEKAAYATPCVYQPAKGAAQLILSSWAHGPSGIDLRTGTPLWELPLLKYRVVGSPLVAGDMVFCACGVGGVGRQMIAVRPGNPTTGTKAERLYEVPLPVPYVCTPVARENLLFAWADKGGIVTCLDIPTGKIFWREKVGGDYFSSPVRVRDRLYNITREGQMVVLAAEKTFKLLAKFPLGEGTCATPAVANGVLYLRTLTHFMAIGGPTNNAHPSAKESSSAPSN